MSSSGGLMSNPINPNLQVTGYAAVSETSSVKVADLKNPSAESLNIWELRYQELNRRTD